MKSADERNIETDIRDAAAARGATVSIKGAGHFQIRGRLLVNYYPFGKKRTAYVAGTTHGKHHTSPTEAVQMAFSAPPIAPVHKKDERHGNPRVQRRRMLRTIHSCVWCGCKLTLNNSTVEHIVPLHRGGLDNANNRTLACKPCNHGRGHNMPELATQSTGPQQSSESGDAP